MMAMLSFVLFNFKQIGASQKCGAFFEFYIENRWTCGKCCGTTFTSATRKNICKDQSLPSNSLAWLVFILCVYFQDFHIFSTFYNKILLFCNAFAIIKLYNCKGGIPFEF